MSVKVRKVIGMILAFLLVIQCSHVCLPVKAVTMESEITGLSFASVTYNCNPWYAPGNNIQYTLNNTLGNNISFSYIMYFKKDNTEFTTKGTASTNNTSALVPCDTNQQGATFEKIVITGPVVMNFPDWLGVSTTVSESGVSIQYSNQSSNKTITSLGVTLYYNDAAGTEKSMDISIPQSNSFSVSAGGSYEQKVTFPEKNCSLNRLEYKSGEYIVLPSQITLDTNSPDLIVSGKMYYDKTDAKYKIDLEFENKSNNSRIKSFQYAVAYTVNGTQKVLNESSAEALEFESKQSKSITLNDSYAQEFNFDYITLSNAVKEEYSYKEHTDISDPTLDDGRYITWSKVTFGNYWQNDTNQDGSINTATDQKQPIEWRVLSSEGDSLLLMSDKALFASPYSADVVGTTWEQSELRSYLNNVFYNDAFTDAEKASVVTSTLDNSSAGPKSSGGNATNDNVFILSVSELNNTAYGLYGAAESVSTVNSRQIEATDYAFVTSSKLKYIKGTNENGDSVNYCNYLLRSPGYYQYDVSAVTPFGILDADGFRVSTKTAAVVPVIRVKKSAATFSGSVTRTLAKGYNSVQAKSVKYGAKSIETDKITEGDKVTINKVTYEVTDSSKKNTVAVTSVRKNAKSVTIPSKVKIEGETYKVTAIKANAFKIAKNKLKSVTIKSTNLTTINKKAFKGLKKDTKVKVVKSKYKKYKKMIKAKNVTVKSLK